MNKKPLDEDLRNRLNEYLKAEYGLALPSSMDSIVDDGADYLYIDDDPNVFIYIPKKAIRQI